MVLVECKKCFEKLPESEFDADSRGRWNNGLNHRCRKCEVEHQAQKVVDAKESRSPRGGQKSKKKSVRPRRKRRKQSQAMMVYRKYNIPPEELIAKRTEQGGRCAICGSRGVSTVSGKSRRKSGAPLHVDHCHKTQHFRGLLCMHCNTGLGHFKDSPVLLRKAAVYLEVNRDRYQERVAATLRSIEAEKVERDSDQ